MKITKYLMGFAVLALAVASTSCNKDNEGDLYKSEFNNVSWEQKAFETTTAENSVTIPVMVTRNDKSGTLTVRYTAEASEEGIFTDNAGGTINFADGEAFTMVNVTAANMDKGATYTYTMTLEDAAFADADTVTQTAVQTVTITVHSDYTWVSAGTCTFIDNNFYDDPAEVEGVPVLMAKENPLIFRIYHPYQYLTMQEDYAEDADYFAGSTDIQFTLNADGTPGTILTTGTEMGADYTFEYDADAYPNYCYFTREGNVYTIGHLIGVDGEPTYIGGMQFVWDKP